MPIIRVTRKQIEAANKAREAALKKDDDFRRHEEQRRRRCRRELRIAHRRIAWSFGADQAIGTRTPANASFTNSDGVISRQ
jgi:hypothetical protein